MKKNNIFIILLLLLGTSMFLACSDINENHDPYLQWGEQIYIGKPDSIHMYAGHNRVEAGIWYSDVRITNLVVKYNGGQDSICIPLVRDPDRPSRSDSVLVKIPNVKEGTKTTFVFITYDKNMRYCSLPVEGICSAFGDDYQSGLFNRNVTSSVFDGDALVLKWLRAPSSQVINTEIEYTDVNGQKAVAILNADEVEIRLEDIKIDSKSIRFRTKYLPEPTALDFFYSEYGTLEIGI